MARLELFLLGPPRLQRDGVPLQFDRRKVMALAAYLAMAGLEAEGRHLSRDSLVTLFSPDLEPSRARAAFRRNLSLLRRALEGEWLVADRKRVGTNPEADFWLDVDQFARLVHSCETHGHPREEVCPRCLEALAEAAALYQGDFLQSFGLRDSVEFGDWQFCQAEELRQQLASVLERLARGHGVQGNREAALPYARRWLSLDPLHELAHRQLMELYAAALRQPSKQLADSVAPAWSPDGQYLAFLTNRSGKWEIWVMRADGTQQRSMFPAGLGGVQLEYAYQGERALCWTR